MPGGNHAKKNRLGDLFFILSYCSARWCAFCQPSKTGTIINDGGMFFVMIADLRAAHFLLPLLLPTTT